MEHQMLAFSFIMLCSRSAFQLAIASSTFIWSIGSTTFEPRILQILARICLLCCPLLSKIPLVQDKTEGEGPVLIWGLISYNPNFLETCSICFHFYIFSEFHWLQWLSACDLTTFLLFCCL